MNFKDKYLKYKKKYLKLKNQIGGVNTGSTLVIETETETGPNEINEPDTTSFFTYTYINPIPESFIVLPTIDNLFSLLFSLDEFQTFYLNLFASYYMPSPNLIKDRLEYITSQKPDGTNAISIYNKEKKEIMDAFNSFKEIYSSFQTLFIKNLQIVNGIISLDENSYFYKILDSLSINAINANKLLKYYKFIMACYNFNIDKEYTYEGTKYKLYFVKVPLKVIFSIRDENFIDYGYLMEFVEGDTIKKIKEDLEYWKLNQNLFMAAIFQLVRELETKEQFKPMYFNAIEHVIWDKNKNTLIYIDIDVRHTISQIIRSTS
jgi:hypothetical protein